MFEVRSFSELVGMNGVLKKWQSSMEGIGNGDLIFVYGFSGTGKTTGCKLLLQRYNTLYLDTDNCEHSKYVYDRILKFHNWKPMFESDERQRVIFIDAIESFMKIERNILNLILSYLELYQENALPIVMTGDHEIAKRMGDIKSHITESICLNRIHDSDIFLFLKSRLPRNKIKLVELMQLAELANGNMYRAISLVQMRLNKTLCAFKSDVAYTFDEIFQCPDPDIISKLLQEDTWMHPLKLHENAIKVLNSDDYYDFLGHYIFFEHWQPEPLAYSYLGERLVMYDKKPIESMEFSKLLSYLSTRKKYKKLNYDFLSAGNINGTRSTRSCDADTHRDRNSQDRRGGKRKSKRSD